MSDSCRLFQVSSGWDRSVTGSRGAAGSDLEVLIPLRVSLERGTGKNTNSNKHRG